MPHVSGQKQVSASVLIPVCFRVWITLCFAFMTRNLIGFVRAPERMDFIAVNTAATLIPNKNTRSTFLNRYRAMNSELSFGDPEIAATL